MRKCAILFPVLFLFALTAGCGGDGGSGAGTVGTSTVKIQIGDDGHTARITVEKYPLFARAGRFIKSLFDTSAASAAIPSDINHVVFTISAPDMATITRDVPVAGKTSIMEIFTVPNGANRRFRVEALYQETVHYLDEASANLDGTPITLVLDMQDVSPPTFAGLVAATAVSTRRVDLSWNAATDNVTPSSQLTYLIYMATSSGGQDFGTPSFTSMQGATSYSVTGLNPGTTYYFVVRARDSAGNIDSNTVQRSVTMSDVTPPVFDGLGSAVQPGCGVARLNLSWKDATDDITPSSQIVYDIYVSTTSGGQDFSAPTYSTSPGATTFTLPGLSAGTYYIVVRARDANGNSDTNTVERSATVVMIC